METVPPPVPPTAPVPPSPANAEARVKPPAIALIIATAVAMAWGVLSILFNILGISFAPANPDATSEQQLGQMIGGGVGIAAAVIGILIGAFVIYAMTRMMKLQQWGVALAGAIIALIPCATPCCIVTLPFGIWAIVILTQPDVKAAFK